MAELIEVTGVVISATSAGENDKRVLLLTRELGRISAFAKGARRPGNHLMAATDSFVFGKFYLYPGRSAYTIEKAEVKNYFKEFSTDLSSAYYGFYFLELADYFASENANETEMVNLIYCALRALLNPQIPNKLVRCIYELRQLVINGEYPDFFSCKFCGSKENLTGFSIMSSGMACSSCEHQKGVTKVSPAALKALQYTASCEVSKLFTFTLSEEALSQMQIVLKQCMQAYIDKPMKSLEMLLMLED